MPESVGLLPFLDEAHPVLHRPSAPVDPKDPALPAELARLHATLADFRRRHGFGRAMSAVQAGIPKRVIVMDLGAGPLALLNPEITWRSTETCELWDDCLSLPTSLVRVRRHRSIGLHYTDEAGRLRHWQRLPAEMAELLQHEMDHLNGVLMRERAVGDDAVQPIAERNRLIGPQRAAHRLSLANICRSAGVIAPEFLNSPQYDCEPLSAQLGLQLTIKLDITNPIRSFKGRGASFLVHEMLAAGNTRALICASAGNWGQAMAYACRAQGLPLTVYSSVNANPKKVERMKALGATVLRAGADFDAAKAAAKTEAARTGAWMVEDGLEPAISEGHGTIGMELLARGAAFDAVVLPLGNGALLAGVARWLKAASPATQVFGVCAEAAPSMERSWRSGQVQSTATADTIADGIGVREPIPEALEDLRDQIDDVLIVSDAQIHAALALTWRHAGLMLEPAGAAGLAGVLVHRERLAGQRVATLLCGSNFLPELAEEILRAN
jgi:threonine dehydratase/peptide deformylase